jgi:uncharacterized membrane protein YqiK
MTPLEAAVLLALISALLVSRQRVRAGPREAVVRLGRREHYPAAAAYQVIHGAGWVWPALERAERLPLGPFSVEVELASVKLGERWARATLGCRVSFHTARPELLRRGVEALLGRSAGEIREIAEIVLGGKLLGALTQVGLPRFDADRDKMRAEVLFEGAALLDTIGLELDIDSLAIEVVEVKK